jgi:hypothetical protein
MKRLALVVLSCIVLMACEHPQDQKESEASKSSAKDMHQPQKYVKIKHPEWSKNAVIYQLNTRQFSEEGTFKAAQEQLPQT